MVDSSDLKRGTLIEIDNVVYEVVDYSRHKPGKGPTSIKTKIKNIKLDTTIDKTFDAGIQLKDPDVEQKEMQYLYKDGENHVFMDTSTFEQISFNEHQLGNNIKFLKEGIVVDSLIYKGEPLGIKLPIAVNLKIIETAPGVRGDTVSGGSKPATLETKLVVNVPLFINIGDVVRIDTRIGEYLERVK
ncbi:MAG: elongation factor P [Candidatus Firestonebacteria bacterium]